MDIAHRYQLPFLATTPTRRANKERVYMAGYNESIITDNVDFLRTIKETANVNMYIGGLMGCKGDAYTSERALNQEEAIAFHSWQASLFKSVGVDFLYAGRLSEWQSLCLIQIFHILSVLPFKETEN